MNMIFDSFPMLVLVTIAVFLVSLLTAWILSITGGFNSEKGKGLRLFLIIPFSSPIASLILAWRDRGAGLPAVVGYGLALIILPLGGLVAKKTEQAKFEDYKSELKNRSISLEVADLIPTPVSDQENIWNHPFLTLMGQAGQPSEGGSDAREILNTDNELSPYFRLIAPKPIQGVQYVHDDDANSLKSASKNGNPFRRLHETALAILAERNGTLTEETLPADWQTIGTLVTQHFGEASEATRQLSDALSRPADHYPFAWDQGFGMLLPHLSKLRAFSISSAIRGSAAATVGHASEVFEMIELGFKLSETGDSDLLISRLVQMAQTSVALEPIRVAQQFHQGTDAQWAALKQTLESINFPEKIPNALNAERALGNSMILPITEASFFDMIQKINHLETLAAIPPKSSSTLEACFRYVVGTLWSPGAQAILVNNWRRALEAYEEMIANVDSTYEKTRSEPWNQCEVPSIESKIHSYGIFAKLLLPALDRAFVKAIESQHQIEIAKVAVDLERYYIAHQSYPESLTLLVPNWVASEPTDPMTGEPWRYERLGTQGFHLYSTGRNGRDDGGVSKKHVRGSSRTNTPDDRGWYVSPSSPNVPGISLAAFTPAATQEVSEALMEQVGIEPK